MTKKRAFDQQGKGRFHDPVEQLTFAFRPKPRVPLTGKDVEARALEENARVSTPPIGLRSSEALNENLKRMLSGSPSPKELISAAENALLHDPFNMKAAETLVGLINDSELGSYAEIAGSRAAEIVRRDANSELNVRTEAFELIRNALKGCLETDRIRLLVEAMPVLVAEVPGRTFQKCAEILESSDYKTVVSVADALQRSRSSCTEVDLLDAVLRGWLAHEQDPRLLLACGFPPVVGVECVERIIADGLAGESPTMRLAAIHRCVHELSASTMRRLLSEAANDEPDEVVMEHIESALHFATETLQRGEE